MPDQIATDNLLAAVTQAMPTSLSRFDPSARPTGLVIVDEVNGFATVGAGNLAPPARNSQVSRMVEETVTVGRRFQAAGWPILAFLDTHEPGKPEPPYPPHCEAGTGEERLVPALEWLETEAAAAIVRKDCINGFVGAIQGGRNRLVDWVNENRLTAVLVVGICTDICVMDFVLTLLSARNHGLMPGLEDIVVYEPGCSTYDLPSATVEQLGLPATAAHPQQLTHHLGLYFMASRGAILAEALD